MTEPFTIQCFCGAILTGEIGQETDNLTLHLLQHHTVWMICKQLAMHIFANSPKYVEGPNQTIVVEK